jgi:hypothetical protein
MFNQDEQGLYIRALLERLGDYYNEHQKTGWECKLCKNAEFALFPHKDSPKEE